MTLLELQEQLKQLIVAEPESHRKLGMAWAIEDYLQECTNITELAQLIMSAKIKQPKKPQPVKYLSENWGYTTNIEKALIFETIDRAKWAVFTNSDVIPYKNGFIVTKPATNGE